VWLDTVVFERIVAQRQQTTLDALSARMPVPVNTVANQAAGAMYVKCPECDQIMNRCNFAKCSGVIVDVCKAHGTWFDDKELPKIVEFVVNGGLEKSSRLIAEREREEARRERDRRSAPVKGTQVDLPYSEGVGDFDRAGGAVVLAEVLGAFWSLFE
jgi:Zn-finger nucleic acid-binding protein